ncbi:tautomerase family protein [Gordonia alkaliphila]|uniref:Tautomerase family protein n=2 Tax=Gordonia TaxID=2053 RepID=A0ABP8Z936_9ACTN|nr:tautomerase family protein [Gordonia alkaliphila]MCK0440813.1 tautomerase family protein [Gordonia alkaliphila]
MPSTQIEVRRSHAPAVETAIIDAVHDSLVAAFAIPVQDKHVRLVAHEPHRFAVPHTLSSPEHYTLVTVDCFAGRSVDAKRALYREIVDRLGALGIPGDHITIVVRDLDTASWGISGGQAACDVELGFDINV